mmetsp:Transcript_1187/g.2915  ORF Transcript_1187/g.2915 Transcript_1187/m.2915 type:complete len:275 (+) Transcript_1187:1811-2635(+)
MRSGRNAASATRRKPEHCPTSDVEPTNHAPIACQRRQSSSACLYTCRLCTAGWSRSSWYVPRHTEFLSSGVAPSSVTRRLAPLSCCFVTCSCSSAVMQRTRGAGSHPPSAATSHAATTRSGMYESSATRRNPEEPPTSSAAPMYHEPLECHRQQSAPSCWYTCRSWSIVPSRMMYAPRHTAFLPSGVSPTRTTRALAPERSAAEDLSCASPVMKRTVGASRQPSFDTTSQRATTASGRKESSEARRKPEDCPSASAAPTYHQPLVCHSRQSSSS